MNQLVVSQDPVGVMNQYSEEIVLGRRKLYLGVADKYLPLAKIDSEIARHKNIVLSYVSSPQSRADTRQQLSRPKRLSDVVVRSSIKRADLLGLLASNRDNDNRGECPLSQTSDNLLTIDIRQIQIEKYQSGRIS